MSRPPMLWLSLSCLGCLIALAQSCSFGQSNNVVPAQSTPEREARNVWAVGDSLTASTYPTQLAKLSQRQVANWGVVSQMSSEIAARVGAVPSFFMIANRSIPAGGKVIVTPSPETPDLLRTGGQQQLVGTLAGISGLLSRSGTYDLNAGIYTFAPTQLKKPVAVTEEARFVPDVGSLPQRIMILWSGRNNYGDITGIQQNIASTLVQRNLSKRFIVLSILNADSPGERRTDVQHSAYDTILRLNATLRKQYPNNFIDIREILSRGNDGDFPPARLRKDELHLNEVGDGIVASEVNKFIKSKGW